ncbi:Genomic scaffold old, msy_sf_16, related [Eimeria tenella]|uniref:Genomic scaffold old, msy_sf_16, related n=1 Tax=Eimeria tenella TaxID=5802 RepID=U6KTL4_EIMTE|nr:Genomic scaffold old, msy_sf_16, related [Eimeria tenella]CDJ41311.1 Genomic scaffold old, msy_sf_16, related [Eimeria tenella]|eukprot:XP_013232061.1 Genomic scaffold old, msy_sf_16, related [Eimeria tenella]
MEEGKCVGSAPEAPCVCPEGSVAVAAASFTDQLPSASTVASPARSEGLEEAPPAPSSPSSSSAAAAAAAAAGAPGAAAAAGAAGAAGGCWACVPTLSDFCWEYGRRVALWARSECGGGSPEAPAEVDSKRELVQQWLQRPARRQAAAAEAERACHVEGQNEYNICKGAACRFKHRLPTRADEGELEWSRDVFGRERHREHREDMGGVGSFAAECRTLFVGGLRLPAGASAGLRELEEFLWGAFAVWGDLESLRVVPKKLIAFVTFAYRVQAEFAKVAMADQPCGPFAPLLTVKWAHQEAPKRGPLFQDPPRNPKPRRELGAPPPRPHERLAAQALHSYCAAWQNYWAAAAHVQVQHHPQQHQHHHQHQHQQQQQVLHQDVLRQDALHQDALHQDALHQDALQQQHEVRKRQRQLQGREASEGEAPEAQWPQEDPETANANVERLMNVLSRVEGLSTADFLSAGTRGVQTAEP